MQNAIIIENSEKLIQLIESNNVIRDEALLAFDLDEFNAIITEYPVLLIPYGNGVRFHPKERQALLESIGYVFFHF